MGEGGGLSLAGEQLEGGRRPLRVGLLHQSLVETRLQFLRRGVELDSGLRVHREGAEGRMVENPVDIVAGVRDVEDPGDVLAEVGRRPRVGGGVGLGEEQLAHVP